MQTLMILLLSLVLFCVIAVAFTKNLLTAAVVFMVQSLALSVVWVLLESPDLAITEAAVGAGIDSLLLFAALKKIHAIDAAAEADAGTEETPAGEEAAHGPNP